MSARLTDGPEELEVMDYMTRISLEFIGQAGLGTSFQALDDIEGKENPYAIAVKQLVSVTFSSYTVHL